ncbi:hypothetical protein G4X40_05680 [Rhodococcus sp. D2-41]|uniref:Uncharacterized protein n=1 Tax=Speluncibacter jeojiensis TaxID=2710754 RepID=A0A9X4M113_9ACTN|nr:hypothetical protein [Rhodococcus sp. D2-41]MDG3009633.1 hypothetical protein [Rhodococcus sp. D2-41]MDG3014382.1 hypothetical protein [Corynebacteriales bacterium D3-21]
MSEGERPGVGSVLLGAAVSAAAGSLRMAEAALGAVPRVPVIGPRLGELVAESAERGRRSLELAAVLSRSVLRVVIREILAAALAEANVTEIVRDHVDLDAIAEQIDVDAVVARVDLPAIVRRLDLDAIVEGVDIERILNRVDVDGVAARIDLERILERLDMIALADEIIQGVDLPQIIRDSTGSLTTEAVRGVRSQGMQADDAVAGFFGRLLGRDAPAEIEPPTEPGR